MAATFQTPSISTWIRKEMVVLARAAILAAIEGGGTLVMQRQEETRVWPPAESCIAWRFWASSEQEF